MAAIPTTPSSSRPDSDPQSRPRDFSFSAPEQRLPYLLVIPNSQSITSLTNNWDKFTHAFFTLFYCHAMLWSVGIHHGDISQSNLMWDPVTEKPKLCDFDHAHICPPPEVVVEEVGHRGSVRPCSTGTWIFMANDLLTDKAMNGHVKRVYRHDVEASIVVLVWIAYRYVDSKLRCNPPFERWNHRDYLHVASKRISALNDIVEGDIPRPSGPPDALIDAIESTIPSMLKHQNGANDLAREIRAAARHRKRLEDAPVPAKLLENYDDLRALRKILAWDLFTELSSATRIVCLLNERILNAANEG